MGEKTDRGTRIGRKAFLKGAGATLGATLVLVAGGGVWRAEEQGVFGAGEGPAFKPWKEWRAVGEDGPLVLVSAAILAANAHNTQPWIFRVGDSRIDLFADIRRDIGSIDPFSREMYIGLGCALENLVLAAHARGYEYDLVLAPDSGDPTHVATIDLHSGSKEVSPLYEAIPERRTNRYAYDTSRPVSRETLNLLEALNGNASEIGIHWFSTREERHKVSRLLVEAAKAINDDREQSYDNSKRWLRDGQDSIQRYRDGLTLDTLGLPDATLLAAKMLPEPSLQASGEAWLQEEERQVETAGAFGILSVRDYGDDTQRLAVGRLWQRMHLWMTAHGLAAQPMNQLHERADREMDLGLYPTFGDALKGLLSGSPGRGIFTFRLGHPTRQASHSPRRAVKSVTEKAE